MLPRQRVSMEIFSGFYVPQHFEQCGRSSWCRHELVLMTRKSLKCFKSAATNLAIQRQ
jgi:hypothetical protein